MNIIEKIEHIYCELTGNEIADQLSKQEVDELLEAVDDCIHYQAFDYGEPGYRLPYGAHTILFGDWNPVSRYVQDVLEALGYELEWSDEWLVCDQGKAWRTSPNSYSWTPSYAITDGGDILTIEGDVEEWIDWAAATDVGHPCRVIPDCYDLSEAGFFLWNEEQAYESGFHVGMTDSPDLVLAEILLEYPDCEVVFQVAEQSQFYTRWDCRVRMEEGLKDACNNGPDFLSKEEVREAYYELKEDMFLDAVDTLVSGSPELVQPWRWDGVCWVKAGYVEGLKYVEWAWNPEMGEGQMYFEESKDMRSIPTYL